jgi:hypothetical protein
MNDRRHEASAQRVDCGGAKRCARQRPLDRALSTPLRIGNPSRFQTSAVERVSNTTSDKTNRRNLVLQPQIRGCRVQFITTLLQHWQLFRYI